MEINNDILTEAETMQKEMHAFVKDLMKRRPKLSYEDAQTVYFLYKLDELQYKIKNATNGIFVEKTTNE